MPATSGSEIGKDSLSGLNSNDVYSLTIHRRIDYDHDVVLNPEYFPDAHVGDFIEVFHPDRDIAQRLLLQISTLEPVKGNLQISVQKRLADLPSFNLQAFQDVIVRRVDPSEKGIEFVEFSFRDQYVSQGDFWRMKEALQGRLLHTGASVSHLGVSAKVNDILLNDGKVNSSCGVVLASTKFIFRSLSARIFWLVQMSKEMWDFAEDGSIYYNRFVDVFARALCSRWKAAQSCHSLSVLMFGRTFYDGVPTYEQLYRKPFDDAPVGKRTSRDPPFIGNCSDYSSVACKNVSRDDAVQRLIQFDHDGRPFVDYYYMALENIENPSYETVRSVLMAEFQRFPVRCGWSLPATKPLRGSMSSSRANGAARAVYGLPSTAFEGNLLEATNLCLSVVDKHFMDRDLSRTGQNIVLFTAGTGTFQADEKLTTITRERMVDNSMAMDIISLCQPPLHVAPLILFKRSSAVWRTRTGSRSAALVPKPRSTASLASSAGSANNNITDDALSRSSESHSSIKFGSYSRGGIAVAAIEDPHEAPVFEGCLPPSEWMNLCFPFVSEWSGLPALHHPRDAFTVKKLASEHLGAYVPNARLLHRAHFTVFSEAQDTENASVPFYPIDLFDYDNPQKSMLPDALVAVLACNAPSALAALDSKTSAVALPEFLAGVAGPSSAKKRSRRMRGKKVSRSRHGSDDDSVSGKMSALALRIQKSASSSARNAGVVSHELCACSICAPAQGFFRHETRPPGGAANGEQRWQFSSWLFE